MQYLSLIGTLLWGQFEVGAAEVLVGLKSKVAGEGGEMEEPSTGDVQVFLTSKESPVSIRGLAVSTIPPLPKSSNSANVYRFRW